MVWRLVNIVIACFLLGIALLWIRSFVVAERLAVQKANMRLMFVTSEGSFIFVRNRVDFSDPDVQRRWFERAGVDSVEWQKLHWAWSTDVGVYVSPEDSIAGFSIDRYDRDFSQWGGPDGIRRRGISVQVPGWFVIVVLGCWPCFLWARRAAVRYAREQRGECRMCGFAMGTAYTVCPVCGEMTRRGLTAPAIADTGEPIASSALSQAAPSGSAQSA
ncbi:MAG TPA: hypothetical protein VL282_19625 [Tepidisphaeraceae bacterium]|jgi:hypothetical protein|nr:hypothetical protein [Tepidisphaeraceae bacterium]